MPLLLRIRRGLTILGVVFAMSVCSYKWLTGKSWLESVYFFVITVSTVGYGEESTATPEVQILTIGVILVGAVTVGYTIGLIVQATIEGQINRAMGIRRMTRDIEQLWDHTVIAGYGRIGRTLAEDLHRRRKAFVIIDHDEHLMREAMENGHLVVLGDATEEDILLEAGILRAETLVVALHGDADNVFLTLTARNVNQGLRIIARGENPATEKKLRQAGADQVVLPALIGARRMAALVTRPHAAELIDHFTNAEKMEVDLEELLIASDHPLVGKTVRQIAAGQRHRLLVIGVRRADGMMIFNPAPDDPFEPNDTLVLMGKKQDIDDFEQCHEL